MGKTHVYFNDLLIKLRESNQLGGSPEMFEIQTTVKCIKTIFPQTFDDPFKNSFSKGANILGGSKQEQKQSGLKQRSTH